MKLKNKFYSCNQHFLSQMSSISAADAKKTQIISFILFFQLNFTKNYVESAPFIKAQSSSTFAATIPLSNNKLLPQQLEWL